MEWGVRRFEWEQRLNAMFAFFVMAFMYALGAIAAGWLVASFVLGSVELARRIW